MPKKTNLFELPFFFLLIGMYPILSLLGNNITEVNPSVVVRPLLFSLALTLLLFLIALLVFRSLSKAAVITSVALILFFTYGHLYNLTGGVSIAGVMIGRKRYLIAFEGLILFLSLVWVARSKTDFKRPALIFNTVAIALLLFPLYQIANFAIRDAVSHRSASPQAVSAKSNGTGQAISQKNSPDIYYIILDMYAREDLLKEVYKLDNQPFLDKLSQLGFYVARCADSNYTQTQLSVSSSINMDYLPTLGNFPADSTDRTPLDELIEHNAVRKFLEPLGYQTVSLSAYTPLKIESAAVSISTDPQDLPNTSSVPLITPFEAMFIKDSALQMVTELPQAQRFALIRDINYPYATHIRQQLFILDKLKEIPNLPGPKFVFVHVQIPHPPLVFGPNGEIVDNPPVFPSNPARPEPIERVNRLYADQVTFVSKRILEDVEAIVQRSSQPPVIILQGDHAVTGELRNPILNAYLLPKDQQKDLYPHITPVNSFRYLLDHLFGASLPMLPDHAYDSTYAQPFVYIERQDFNPACREKP